MTIIGVVRSVGYYSDGIDRIEIAITDPNDFPVKLGRRVEYNLRIDSQLYKVGIRATENAGAWVSPDLYDANGSEEKIRLADVLFENGFEKNQKVSLHVNTKAREFTVEPLAASKRKSADIPFDFGIGKNNRSPFDENDEHLERVKKLVDVAHAEELIDIFQHYVRNLIPARKHWKTATGCVLVFQQEPGQRSESTFTGTRCLELNLWNTVMTRLANGR